MLMSTSSFASATVLPLPKEQKVCTRLVIRAQSLHDEGSSSNLVDSNMKLLKVRIEVMRAKERLERNHRLYGWDYASQYIQKQRPKRQPEYLQTIALICGTSSLPILIGTIFLCIFSIVVHLKI